MHLLRNLPCCKLVNTPNTCQKKSHFVNAVNIFRMSYTSFKPQENGVCRRQNSENLAKNKKMNCSESREGLTEKSICFPTRFKLLATHILKGQFHILESDVARVLHTVGKNEKNRD